MILTPIKKTPARDCIVIIYRLEGIHHERSVYDISSVGRKLGFLVYVITSRGAVLKNPDISKVYFCPDPDNRTDVLSIMEDINSVHPIHRLFALDEEDVLTAGYCREQLGIPGLNLELSRNFRDKILMKAAVNNCITKYSLSLKIPVQIHINPDYSCDNHDINTFPVIIKPFDGMGTIYTFKVNSKDELMEKIAFFRKKEIQFIIEEYISGTQYHCDSIIKNGKPVLSILSGYTMNLIDFRDFYIGTVTRIGSRNAFEEQILSSISPVVEALGLKDGITHTEFYLAENGDSCSVFFGEIACRLPGGSILPLLDHAIGGGFVKEWAKSELIDGYLPLFKKNRDYGALMFNIEKLGEIRRICPPEMLFLSSVVEVELTASPGTCLTPSGCCTGNIVGYIIASGDSREEITDTLSSAGTIFNDHLEIVDMKDIPAQPYDWYEESANINFMKDYCIHYICLLPAGYKQNSYQLWPVILFLHGMDERGDNPELLKKNKFSLLQNRDQSFILIAPLCPGNTVWTLLLDELSAFVLNEFPKYQIDFNRIYVVGYSMGAIGAWHLAESYPSLFTAIVPIAGGANKLLGFPERVKNMINIPVWAIHGKKDETLPVSETVELIDALNEYGGSGRLTLFEDKGHDCLEEALGLDELLPWLLEQKNK